MSRQKSEKKVYDAIFNRNNTGARPVLLATADNTLAVQLLTTAKKTAVERQDKVTDAKVAKLPVLARFFFN